MNFVTYSSCLLLIVGINLDSHCQTGVAGVGNSSTNKVWLDAHSLGLSDGAQVGTFTDASGNSNNFTQSTSSKRPVYETTAINGMPALDFDGVNDYMLRGVTSGLETTKLTYFMVFQRSTMANQMLINAKYASSPTKWRMYSNAGSNNLISAQYSPTVNWAAYVDPGSPTFVETQITGSALTLYKQGSVQQIKVATYTAPTGHQELTIGGTNTGAYSLNGYIAEVIVYNNTLNNLQRIMIENYLGAKYGMAIPTDLYAFEATHNIGLVGIGSNGTDIQSTAQGAGVMELSNASSMNSGDYLLVAHDDVALSSFTNTDLPPLLTGYDRWTRVWRADETNNIGTTDVKFFLAGGNDYADPTTYTLIVDTDGDFTNASIYAGTYNAINQTVTFNVDLNDGDFFTLAGETQILDIHSITSGDWNSTSTWDCNCLPSFQDNVFIEPFNSVTVDADGETGNLSIEPNGSLLMNTSATLSIYKDTDIAGTLNFTDGNLAFVGFSDQYLDAGGNTVTLNDVTIDKTGTLTVYESDYILNGTLSPIAGALTIDPSPNNNFIINSTTAGTEGRVGAISAPFAITGEFVVKRFLPAGNDDWRDLCSPVIGATFDDWDPDIYMSGPGFPDGCAYESDGTCYKSVRYTNANMQYYVYNSTDPITNGRGYSVWIGDDMTSFSGATLSVKGTIRDYNDVVLNFTTGWATLGNPYASPVNFSSCTKSSSIGNYFYVYDTNIGDYQWYDGASNTASISEIDNGTMNTAQGVWILANSAGSITFSEAAKTTSGTYIRAHEMSDIALKLTLSEQNSTYKNTITLLESDISSDGLDTVGDMKALIFGFEKAPGFNFIISNEQVKRNYIASDGIDKSFELAIQVKNDGYYSINAENLGGFDHYLNIMLLDKYTNELVDLRNNDYIFYGDSSEVENRFTLLLTNQEYDVEQNSLSTSAEINTSVITQMGNVVRVDSEVSSDGTILVYNLLGQSTVINEVFNFQKGPNYYTLPVSLEGVYLLTVNIGNETITKKVVF